MKYVVMMLLCAMALGQAGSDQGGDTLHYCTYNGNSNGQSGSGELFGFGVKFTPAYYPAVVNGAYFRAFPNFSNLAQFRVVDDDGSDGAPGTTLVSVDTLFPSHQTSFVFYEMPNCTIPDGDFYLFILSRYDSIYGGNWLHDGDGRAAPAGAHWRHVGGVYTQYDPTNDFQICAVVDYLTGIREEEGRLPARSMDLSPSPASEFVTLKLHGVEASMGQVKASIFDATGQCVLVRRLVTANCNLAIPFDIRSLSNDVYLVRLDAGGTTQTRKLVVARQ